MKRLRGRVSGLCQPAYVLDIPGGHGKAPIGPDHLSGDAEAGYVVEDYRGGRHVYPPVASTLTPAAAPASPWYPAAAN